MNTRFMFQCLFLVMLLYSAGVQAQFESDLPLNCDYYSDFEESKGGSSVRAICQGNNLNGNPDRYKLQQNFSPAMNQGVKTIRMNFHSIQNSTQVGNKGNFENTSADLNFLNMIVSHVNNLFSTIAPPLNPQTCVCGSNCTLPDSRIRVKLENVHFDYDPSLYGSSNASAMLNNLGQNLDTELNVFFNGDNGGYPGGFTTLPSYTNLNYNQFIVLTNYNQVFEGSSNLSWDALGLANNLFHELGHVLGLLHTYSATCCPETMSTTNFDYLDDFFGGTNGCPQLAMPVANWCNVGPDDTCSKNWVGAFTTQSTREATTKQLGRVHRTSMLSSARKYFEPNTTYVLDHLVTQDETWDFDIRMYGDIVVKSGATLTIRCKVNMPPGASIIVEENGTLIIDEGTITDIENKTWYGIQLDGDQAKTQWPESGYYHHGRLITKNGAVVENAINAIMAYSGGIVEATSTQFLNNVVDARFWFYTNKYPSYAGSLAGKPAPNISYFTDCDFHTTKTLNTGDGHPDEHIHFLYVDGINIRKSSFKNTLTTLNSNILNRGYGIYSDESSFSVKGSCTSIPQLGSPCNSYEENVFEGLAYGVYATSWNPMHTVDVEYCLFKDNWRGVYINGMDHSTVSNSEFNINLPPGWTLPHKPYDQNYGIYIRDALGFEVEGNTMNTQSQANYGVYTNNTNIGVGSNEAVKLNKFTGINTAVAAHGRNDGLLYRCNEFYNTQSVSIAVVSHNGRIASPQGTCNSSTTPASNYFDHAPCSQGYEVWNTPTSSTFTYNAHSAPSNYIPACNWNFILNVCNSTYNPAACSKSKNYYLTTDKIAKAGLDELHHRVIRDGLISKIGVIDNGDTAFLIDEINTQSDPSSLFNTLMEASPYLSDQVMTEMLIRPNALGDEEKTEILIANSSLTVDILNTLNTLNPPFSEDLMNAINNEQGPVSPRAILEDEILEERRSLELMTSDIVRQYIEIDTIVAENTLWQDAAINVLNSVAIPEMEGLHSNVQVKLAQLYMSKGDITTADAILEDFESTVNNNYQSNIMRMAIAQQLEGATILDIGSSELAQLEIWSEDTDTKGHASAAWLLAAINESTYPEEFAEIDFDTGEGKITNTEDKDLQFDKELMVFPNPSDGLITIAYEGAIAKNENVKIYSLNGQLIYNQKMKESRFSVDLNHVQSGIYMVRYKDQLTKFVIHK